MYSHTLIVSTVRMPIPKAVSIDIVRSLIHSGVAMVEYFGQQIDHCEDYVEEDMKKLSEENSYFEFYFDKDEPLL